ncbi:MAG: WD40 repeat domain-containing protein [Oscillatoria sp. SIO1A7]|nr:WD40 repeat domain-containing protein [Oscillatoria sp. SIO1A7]
MLGELCGLLWGTSLFGAGITGALSSGTWGNLSYPDLCVLFALWRDNTLNPKNDRLQRDLLEATISGITASTHVNLEQSQQPDKEKRKIQDWLKRIIAALRKEIPLDSSKDLKVVAGSSHRLMNATPAGIASLNPRERSQELRKLKQKIESTFDLDSLPAGLAYNIEQDWFPCTSLYLADNISDSALGEFLQEQTQKFASSKLHLRERMGQPEAAINRLTDLLSNPQTCLSAVQVIDFDIEALRKEVKVLREQIQGSLANLEDPTIAYIDSWLTPDPAIEVAWGLLGNKPELPTQARNKTRNNLIPTPAPLPTKSSEPPVAPTAPPQPSPPPAVVRNWKCIRTIADHADSVVSVAFGGGPPRTVAGYTAGDTEGETPELYTLASGSWDRTIKIWAINPAGGTPIPIRTLTAHSASVYSVAFSQDGQTLASGGVDCTIQLWHLGNIENTSTGASLLRTLTGHSFPVYCVGFSADARLLASGSGDYTVKLWNLSSGKLLSTLAGHSSFVYSVAFSPDGQTIATGSADKTIKIWQVTTGQLLRTLISPSPVNCIAFSPDRRFLISGSRDETIKLWRLGTGSLGAGTRPAPTLTLTGHSAEVLSVAISPREPLLASSSHDKTIKLWSLEAGTLVANLTGHLDSVNSVAFSPNGNMLASASHDKTIKIWRRGKE